MIHRDTKSYIWLLVILAAASHSAVSEVQKQQPARIEGTSTYTDRSYGFSIDLASDFHLSSEQQDVLFFRSRDRVGTVIIRPRPGLAVSTIQAAMRNGFESDSIKLTPIGPPESLKLSNGQGLLRAVVGEVDGVEVEGMFAGVVGGNQQGYMILVGSVKNSWPGFKFSAHTMLNSLTINPVEPGYAHERWQKRLQGYRLVFVQGYDGAFAAGVQVSEYNFCSDGTFRQRTDTSDSYSTGYRHSTYGTTAKDKGTWRVQLQQDYPFLSTISKNGSRSTFPITDKEGYIFLGDVPYQMAKNELCH